MTIKEPSFCTCAETLIEKADGTKVRIPSPEFHNCAEVKRRNSFISKAAFLAQKQCGEAGSIGYGNRWTKAFAREMERLVAA
jgi:hypothetical protein